VGVHILLKVRELLLRRTTAAFLNAGYYGIFGKAVGELCAEYGQPASPEAALHLLDAGLLSALGARAGAGCALRDAF